jgi:ABC-type multidrug transport system fused ATPase/permease subunit
LVLYAHRFLVFDSGRVVVVGLLEELLSLGGAYKRLYDLQFRS